MNLVRRLVEQSGELVFDRAADSVEAVQRTDVLRYAWVCDWVRDWGLSTAKILDFGCWTGGFLYQLEHQVVSGQIHGADLDGPWLDVARKVVPSGIFTEFTRLLELRSADEYDFVFLLETLEHLPRGTESRTLQEISEVIKQGGSLVISVPLAGLLAPLDPAWSLLGHRHYRSSTLASMLNTAGFEVVETCYAGNVWEAISELRFLAIKHLRHRIPESQPFLRQRADTGIRPKWYPSATGIYLRARKL